MSRLADPKTLMAIKDLPLAAKTTVDGFLAGIHNSSVKGIGMEFSQYRSYQPGDDLRRLDWKMFARSDRYYIRESEIETSISVRLLVDASASMNHTSGAFTKIEYARYLAASLAYLAQRQGDATGLFVFRQGELFSLPARQDHQHLARIYYQLEQIDPQGGFTNPVDYKSIFSGINKRELLIFITDYYEQDGEISRLLHALASNKHEIIVFHLLAPNEINLDYKGFSTLEDLETGKTIRIDPSQSKQLYKQALEKYLADVRAGLLDKNIFYRLINTEHPVDEALRDFLVQRNKIRG
ncbi:DUF58 domain-containing protein [Segetibacter sp. 3557_3]|uniref:DUF58 domain-containing protein n=1 Tax=Segetibacter sp. 3557_3 TaxID=2547429 RepID=UPI001A9F0AE7|nr:DUF58 domain-containing protein [Segetibacter sp. 3557_3]